ncbi:uncharacterized protein MELLADRAFT_93921 [Melampsora larici-populina 98AG31]|uniref:Uncharacterized protein n=1 Tax=Melampsora larici-populina (strain 98AG31 / pathotype 3-4-7) TaxID=747676 RepID=F4S5R9_MELLP|nr:uncharacterized protein MELLADRAFT_93921 [Melampsora larici-populina 98AG31]EGG00017.1 hypothetical protein MELLADRAFT_93921 [Melampsora larici-populina 98AG31]
MVLSYKAVIGAILRATADPVPVDPAKTGMAWRGTATDLVLVDAEGKTFTVPLEAFGFNLPSDLLRRDHTYHLSGDLGQKSTGEAFIKHSELTQSKICSSAPDHESIAGKTTMSAIGKVVNVSLDNDNEDEEFHLTVEAEHEGFDPRGNKSVSFEIIYRFGYFTPALKEARYIKKGSSVYFQGTLVSQDPQSKRFIVQVMQHAEIAVTEDGEDVAHGNVVKGNVVWVE